MAGGRTGFGVAAGPRRPKLAAPRRRSRAARGLLLPIVLLIVAMLALVAATFAFVARAEFRAMASQADQFQARLTAEAGLQRVMLMLRTERNNMDAWWNNQDELHRSVVWLPGEDPSQYSAQTKVEQGQPVWWFSIVADDPLSDEPDSVRYGITDELGKLNLNAADPNQLSSQLTRLFSELVPPEIDAGELVDALLDWRDADEAARPKGAENDYYRMQDPPTRCKNGPLESVEELLLIRGYTADILYGEDYNRNGILDANEDDGEESLPNDNADGTLSRGLYPYLTVYSREFNVASDNRQRININASGGAPQSELEEFFSPTTAAAIAAETGGGTLTTPAELYARVALTPEELHEVMDRLTADPAPVIVGRVNVNTASPVVLRAVLGSAGIDPGQAANLVATRQELTGGQKRTIAWLAVDAGLSAETFAEAAKVLTASPRQFHVESLGYAEHVGVFCRLEAIIEMRGQAAAVVYLRDLTSLGMGYPVRLEFGEGTFARQTRR